MTSGWVPGKTELKDANREIGVIGIFIPARHQPARGGMAGGEF
jgi:hypothetical protein